jgi:hypothetical protein
MEKFWEWMREKGYGYMGSKGDVFIYGKNEFYKDDSDLCFANPPKQMLIGYMIEYLVYNDYTIVDDIFYHGCPQGVSDVYNHLEQIIKREEVL